MILYLKSIYYVLLELRLKLTSFVFFAKWRSFNKHNYTIANSIFPIDIVSVGKMSYGSLNIHSYSNGLNEKLIIKDYVSIANQVNFILGGNHKIDTFSTYPFKNFLLNIPYQDAFSKGPIIINSGVWIGFGSTILSGVEIGKGAIVAAGSTVIKDIPPFAIVGGNPAKILKFRFSEEIIDVLNSIDTNLLDDEFVKNNIESFYNKLNTIKDLDFLLKYKKDI